MFIRHHEAPWPQLVWAVVRGLVGLHYSVPRDLPFGPGPVLPHGGIKRQVGALHEGDWAAGLARLLLELAQNNLCLLFELQEILLCELRFL